LLGFYRLVVSFCKERRLPEVVDLLLLGAGQLLTCRELGDGPKRGGALSDIGLVTNGAVAVSRDKIFAAGTREDVEKKIGRKPVALVVDADGRVVLPGWVDPHSHAVFTEYRSDEFEARIAGDSYLDIERRGGGIKRTVNGIRKADEERLFELSRRRLARMLEYGVTTIEIKSGYGLDLINELKMLRVISRLNEEGPLDVIPTFMGAHQRPQEHSEGDSYVRLLIDEMIPAVAAAGLAGFIDVFCEEGVFSIEETRDILEAGRRAGFGLKIHADEITALGGAELAVEMGAISAEHLIKVSREGVRKLGQSNTVAVLLPCTSLGLASSTFAPARELIGAGAIVALATDYNPGSAPSGSMPLAVAIACSEMRMRPAEAINAATINAAHAVGKGQEVGSIEEGKKADVVIYDAEDYREIPARAGVNLVAVVVKAGVKVWENEGFRERSEVGI
jgi:imidazolonepropionase